MKGDRRASRTGRRLAFGSLRGLNGSDLPAGEAKTPPKSYPPQPQLVPLNEVLPNTGMPLITSDPPPWDATAVDRNPP